MATWKRWALLLVVVAAIVSVTAGPVVGQGHLFVFDRTTGTISDYVGNQSHVLVPDHIDGVPVVAIGVRAFMDSRDLESLVIPETVTRIGGGAFAGCNNLTSVTLPDSITEIGARAFAGCESLAELSLPRDLSELGAGAFWGCTSLTSIVIPDGVSFLGTGTFAGCESLASVTLFENLWWLDNAVFAGCHSLVTIAIPESVGQIGYQAFADCSSLQDIFIPENVTAAAPGAFRGCVSLQNIAVADSNPSYTSIDGVLFNKAATKLIAYPVGLESKHYRVPEGVRSIAEEAFWGCQNLTSMTIPASVTDIGERAFWSCQDLVVSTPENSYVHRSAARLGVQIQVLAAAVGDAAPAPLSDEQLRQQLPMYQSQLHGLLEGVGGSYPEDIREFEYYNSNETLRELVEHLLALGYGVRQVEGYYDLYVGERPRYRGEPFIPERWSDKYLLEAVDSFQVDLDAAFLIQIGQTFPEHITDLDRYQTDADFREWIQYLAAIGYDFQRAGSGYQLHVGESK